MQIRSILLLLLLAAAPAAALDVSGTDEARKIPATGSTTLSYTITVDCADFLTGTKASFDITLTDDLPDYYGSSSEGVTIEAGAGCLNADAQITGTADLVLTPTADAFGHTPKKFNVTVSDGTNEATFTHAQPIQIEYVAGHTLATSVGFPYEFQGDALAFNVTIDIQANAQTMVMFMEVATGGTLSGLTHQIFDVELGDRNRVLPVVWTPPAGAWTNDTITFYNFSHCLKGSPCDDTNGETITWEIHNMAPGGDSGSSNGGSKDSPGAPLFAVLALLGLAAVLVRRR